MAEIKRIKSGLKDDLELLENGFDYRLNKLKFNFFGTAKPSIYIQKKPFTAVGLAVFSGLVIGLSRKKKSKKTAAANSRPHHTSRGPGFGGLLFDEVKRIAAHRAANYISSMIEQKISENS